MPKVDICVNVRCGLQQEDSTLNGDGLQSIARPSYHISRVETYLTQLLYAINVIQNGLKQTLIPDIPSQATVYIPVLHHVYKISQKLHHIPYEFNAFIYWRPV